MNGSVSLLLVEDDDELREQLCEVLVEEGYQVEAVGSGQQAVALAGRQAFDIVLTDIRMPGIDGLEALRQVRESQPDVRSLVLTGYSSEADSIRAIGLGVSEYLKKPIRLEPFLEAVRRLATQRQEQKQQQERQRAWIHTSRVAVETFTRELPGQSDLLAAGALAARLALEMGRSAFAADQLALAALAAALHATHPELVAALPTALRSAAVTGLARFQGELGEEEVGADAELVAFALLAATGTGVEGFSPALREAWERCRHADSGVATTHTGGRERHALLSLARALQEGGDAAGADAAYAEVVQLAPTSREAVEAWLGRARLALRQNRTDALREAAQAAYRAGEQLGPLGASESALEVGLLLAPLGLAEGRACLERASAGLRDPAPAALARLALAFFGGAGGAGAASDVEEVFAPTSEDLVHRASAWLPEALLQWNLQQPQPALERACRRLARDSAPRFAELARHARTEELRAAATALLSNEELLRELLSDGSSLVRAQAARALERSGAQLGPPQLRLYSFGVFTVYLGEHRVEEKLWRSINVRWILARLARARRPVATEVLVDEFWPEEAEVGRRNLYWATSVLRRCLTPPGWHGDLEFVERMQQGLRLNPELPIWHDLDVFEDAVAEAARLDGEAALPPLRRALSAYRGAYLEGCYMEWALQTRSNCERQVLEAGRRLASLTFELGRFADTLEAAARVLELDSCCQDAYLKLMQASCALGRPEESLRWFDAGKKALHRELGLEPSIEMLREQQRALLAIP